MQSLSQNLVTNRQKDFIQELNLLSLTRFDATDFFASLEPCFKSCYDNKNIEKCTNICLRKYKNILYFHMKPEVFAKMKEKLIQMDSVEQTTSEK